MPEARRYAMPPTSGNAYMRDILETSLLAAVVGSLTGLVAVGVRIAITFVTGLLFHREVLWHWDDFRSPGDHALGWLVVGIPALGALVAWAIIRVTTEDKRIRGASEIVRSVAHRRGSISRRRVFGHALANTVSVGSGGSAGREGIMVQMGAVLGMIAARILGSSPRHRKILLAAGGAAAIGATFNTPIAGVIFAAEVILVEWSTRSFIPLTVASAMGVMTATRFLGSEPTFPIPGYTLASGRELLLYLALGVLCGLLSILMLRALALSDRVFSRVPGRSWVAPVLGGLMVGAIGFYVPQVLGVGYETVQLALNGDLLKLGIAGIALILGAKLVAYAITRGSGGASGAFSPSLFAGALLGAAFGALAHQTFPSWTGDSGAYALVAMAAVFAAVTRASLTAVVMLYEMTHTFSIVIPVMLAVVIADALAKAYGTGSYYQGHAPGAIIETDASVNVLDIVTVGEIMTREVDTVRADAPVRQVVEKRFTTGHQGYPVVDPRGELVGILTNTDLRTKVKENDLDRLVREFMTRDPATVHPSTTAHHALSTMVQLDVGHLPVVEEGQPRKLVGILTRQDLIAVERRVLEEEARTESAFQAPRTFFKRDG